VSKFPWQQLLGAKWWGYWVVKGSVMPWRDADDVPTLIMYRR
jgi:hypothetical protein